MHKVPAGAQVQSLCQSQEERRETSSSTECQGCINAGCSTFISMAESRFTRGYLQWKLLRGCKNAQIPEKK